MIPLENNAEEKEETSSLSLPLLLVLPNENGYQLFSLNRSNSVVIALGIRTSPSELLDLSGVTIT